jgi:hypothetical protein
MKHSRFAFLCIAASFIPVTAFGKPASSPQNARPTIHVVPIYLSNLRAIAALRIGDRPPAPVVFDTGTSGNDIDSDYAAAVKLQFDPNVHAHVGDGSGKTLDAKEALLPAATLGEVPIEAKTATVFPYKERDVVGIFGPGSFAGQEVLLDLGHGRLIVRDRGASSLCRKSTPYTPSGLPTVMLRLPGLTVPALLDSGSNIPLFLSESLASKLPLRGRPRSSGKGTTVTGEHDEYEARLAANVRIGHLVLRDPAVGVGGDAIANIGLPVIRQMVIMLDPERRQVCIPDRPSLSAARLAAYAGRYGIRTTRVAGTKLILQRDGNKPYALHGLGGDIFVNNETGDVVQFWRRDGRVVRMDFVNNVGVLTSADKSPAALLRPQS